MEIGIISYRKKDS